jgi:GntR family transcriptional regulator, histidine utilization repressor
MEQGVTQAEIEDDIEAEVLARGELYRFELMSRSAYNALRIDEIALAGKGGRVLYLSGVHFASEKPLAVEQRLINLTVLPDAEKTTFAEHSPGHWLAEKVKDAQVETRVSADLADPETLRLLKAEAPLACLMVRRRVRKGEHGITSAMQAFVGDAYRITIRSS